MVNLPLPGRTGQQAEISQRRRFALHRCLFGSVTPPLRDLHQRGKKCLLHIRQARSPSAPPPPPRGATLSLLPPSLPPSLLCIPVCGASFPCAFLSQEAQRREGRGEREERGRPSLASPLPHPGDPTADTSGAPPRSPPASRPSLPLQPPGSCDGARVPPPRALPRRPGEDVGGAALRRGEAGALRRRGRGGADLVHVPPARHQQLLRGGAEQARAQAGPDRQEQVCCDRRRSDR